MTRKFHVDIEGEEAFERARRALEAENITKSDVTRVAVTVEYEGDIVTEQLSLDDVDLEEYTQEIDVEEYGPPETERAEIGPVEKDMSGVNAFVGSKMEGAVNPSTLKADVMNGIDGVWKTSAELSDELEIETSLVSAYFSDLYYDYGYVKRRDDEKPYEYALTDSGRRALERGKDL